MSTVIRDAIIRVKLEQHKASIEAGGGKKLGEGYEHVKKAAEEATKAQKEAGKATVEFERAAATSNYRMVASFREGGEGAMRMARGLAFLSASGSESLQRLVQKVALAQGAFDVFAGGAKMISNLGAAFGGPVAIGVTAATVAITAGVVAWSNWKKSAEDAAKKAKEEMQKAAQAVDDFYEKQQQNLDEARSRQTRDMGFGLNPREKEKRIRENIASEQMGGEIAGQDIDRLTMSNVLSRGQSKLLLDANITQGKAAQRQAELTRDLYEIQREQFDAQRKAQTSLAGFGVAGGAISGGGFGALGASLAGTAILRDTEARSQQVVQGLQNMINDLLQLVDKSSRDVDILRKQLDNANPN